MGVGDQRNDLGPLIPGKTRYPLYRRLGGRQDRSGRVRKTSLPPGFNTRTSQAVASRYTDWSIPALSHINNILMKCCFGKGMSVDGITHFSWQYLQL